MNSLYIAWKYVCFHRGKTAVLIAAVTLIAALPIVLEQILGESEKQLTARASNTPLIVGAKGSSLDLVMNSLYFDDEQPETISMRAVEQIEQSKLALPIPLDVRFKAHGFPIVGTSLDYFEFRKLEVANGRGLALLGEVVLGAAVAKKLGLFPGDTLLSSPENMFDLAGAYPLKMKVVGVLKEAHTPDDSAVFVDIKTSWVISGIGHGHQDLEKASDASVILDSSANSITANAKLYKYTEITEENRGSFHFHGGANSFPITAVLAIPNDEKSGTILRGRFLESGESNQISRPIEVVDSLLQNIFRIKNVLDAVIAIVAVSTLLALILVFVLSLRLRKSEMETMYKLGCSKSMTARLLGAEISIIVLVSALLCGLSAVLVQNYASLIVRAVLLS